MSMQIPLVACMTETSQPSHGPETMGVPQVFHAIGSVHAGAETTRTVGPCHMLQLTWALT